ncbi:hypothetical protein ABBQ32_002980 [Trebouxia sp. C0010 RCD-2024]
MLLDPKDTCCGTPAAGRHCNSRDHGRRNRTIVQQKRQGVDVRCLFPDLAIAAEGSYFVHKAEQVSSAAWDL